MKNKITNTKSFSCDLGDTVVTGSMKIEKHLSVLCLNFYQDCDTSFDMNISLYNVTKQDLIDLSKNILDMANKISDEN